LAWHPELPGCKSFGDTVEAATEALRDARATYIVSLLEDGLEVPQPLPEQNPLVPAGYTLHIETEWRVFPPQRHVDSPIRIDSQGLHEVVAAMEQPGILDGLPIRPRGHVFAGAH